MPVRLNAPIAHAATIIIAISARIAQKFAMVSPKGAGQGDKVNPRPWMDYFTAVTEAALMVSMSRSAIG